MRTVNFESRTYFSWLVRVVAGFLCSCLAIVATQSTADVDGRPHDLTIQSLETPRVDVSRLDDASRLKQVDRVASRLSHDSDVKVILAVLDAQLHARIDADEWRDVQSLASAGVDLAESVFDASSAAAMRAHSAMAVVRDVSEKRGLQLLAQAWSQQLALRNSDKQHPAPSRLYYQAVQYAEVLVGADMEDVVVDVNREIEKLIPYLDNVREAGLLNRMFSADIKVALGDHEAAIVDLSEALRVVAADGSGRLEARIRNKLADIDMERMHFHSAEDNYQIALRLYLQANRLAEASNVLTQLSQVHLLRDKAEAAYGFAKRALEVAKATKRTSCLVCAWLAVARSSARTHSRTQEALTALAEAERLSPQPRSVLRSLLLTKAEMDIRASQGNLAAQQEAQNRADKLMSQQELSRRQLQTRVARAVFQVNDRELKLRLLERESEVGRLKLYESMSRSRWLGAIVVLAALALAVVSFGAYTLYRKAQLLKERNSTDNLTGTLSRSAILAFASEAFAVATVEKRAMSVCVFDFDNFKFINDEFGHDTGDDVLRKTAAEMMSVLRAGDAIGRIGGDEFLLVAIASESEAIQLAQRVRQTVSSLVIARDGRQVPVGVSSGVASVEHVTVASVAELIQHADTLLLATKRIRRLGYGAPGRHLGLAQPR
jgi:diguanylate cyclase (GGDEF)-like protein